MLLRTLASLYVAVKGEVDPAVRAAGVIVPELSDPEGTDHLITAPLGKYPRVAVNCAEPCTGIEDGPLRVS